MDIKKTVTATGVLVLSVSLMADFAVAPVSALGNTEKVPTSSHTQVVSSSVATMTDSEVFNAAQNKVANATTKFKDLNSSHWAYGAIMNAVNKGYLKGYPDGTFKPSAPVTRAEFAALMSRVSTNPDSNPAASFSDLPADHWAANGVSLAVQKGFVDAGKFTNGFKPAQAITRNEMAQWMTNGLITGNSSYQEALRDLEKGFIPVAEYYKGTLGTANYGTVGLMIGTGLMSGMTDGSFAGTNVTTRAEVASILLRLEDIQRKSPGDFKVLEELREISLTGTNVESLGFVVRSAADSHMAFKDFRRIYGSLNNGLGSAATNRVIVVDQNDSTHPLTKMFVGAKSSFEGKLTSSEYLVFMEIILVPNKQIHGGNYKVAFKDMGTVSGMGFSGDNVKQYGLTVLPLLMKDVDMNKGKSETYWSANIIERKYKGGIFSGVYLDYNGKTFSALPPGADPQ